VNECKPLAGGVAPGLPERGHVHAAAAAAAARIAPGAGGGDRAWATLGVPRLMPVSLGDLHPPLLPLL
jgi:hypothetical protein